ncbi:SGNH/GDSL hydrolase family protein [Arthrobacter sp.]|uniref:SGNH/GDSL hydrolase family protein n=1 Tax=Arthrobacter sp. TaxID=1667 RepID=UPI003A945A12
MTGYQHVAALGSSFAAGPGIDPVVDAAARRSGNNYAHLLARDLGTRLTDLSVSGATTATILERAQRVGLRSFPPQVTLLPSDADLITVTAGGNDLHYVGSLLKCALAGSWRGKRWIGPLARRFPAPRVPDPTDADVRRAADGLARIVEAARHRAPQARVVLVDYLTLLGRDTEPERDVPFDRTTVERIRAIGADVACAFQTAASSTGAELVLASELSAAHGVGAADPWVNSLVPRPAALASSFHPNATGMRAVADAVLAALDS